MTTLFCSSRNGEKLLSLKAEAINTQGKLTNFRHLSLLTHVIIDSQFNIFNFYCLRKDKGQMCALTGNSFWVTRLNDSIPTTNLQVTKVAEMFQFSRKQVRPLFHPTCSVLKIFILLGLQYFATSKKCRYKCLSSRNSLERCFAVSFLH